MVVVSPDLGGVTRARKFSNYLDLPIAIIEKRRPRPNVSEVMNIIGDIEGKTCIIVDDIIDTAGTITNAANALIAKGAKKVYITASHGVFSGKALEKFKEMIQFRDETAKKLGIEMLEYINEDGVKKGINPFDYGSVYTDIMKTQALKQALNKYGFTAAFGGGRRDEEKSRAMKTTHGILRTRDQKCGSYTIHVLTRVKA